MFRRICVSLLAAAFVAAPARADFVFTFDNPGDVTLAPSKGPGVWYTDRYAPAGFQAGQTAPDGKTGTLQHSISSSDASSSRPAAFVGPFYNTQGRAHDLPVASSSLFINLFVDSAWNALSQTPTAGSGRLAGLWGTGVDNTNAITAYPIIEFNNDLDGAGKDGFRVYDVTTGTWINVNGFTGYDQWYQIGFELNGANLTYFVNGNPVNTMSNNGTTSLSNVILQGYNAGNSYDIYWDNMTNQVIPEPTSIALFGLMGCAAVGGFVRRRKTAIAS